MAEQLPTNPHDQTDRMDVRINRLVADLFFDEITVAAAAAKGVDNVFVLYAAGRAGAMGDVTAEQVGATFVYFAPNVVRDVWSGVPAFGTPSAIAETFAAGMCAAACSRWQREQAAEIVRLAGRVMEHVEPIGMPLFAGWRGMARRRAGSGDARAEALLVLQALRELRGDIHVQSVAASGLSPLEAEMVSRGAPGATLHGWQPPFPDPAESAERMRVVDASTSARMSAVYAAALHQDDLTALDQALTGLRVAG